MNLFFLHHDPKKCAEYHCDKHVVKMIIELAQMLYTAHYVLKSELPSDHYKPCHIKHPTCIWIRQKIENYTYAADLAVCLAEEYTHRYGRVHSTEKHARWLQSNLPNFTTTFSYTDQTWMSNNKNLEKMGMSEVPLAMPDDSKLNDTIQSYRRYYLIHKKRFVKWTSRTVPPWFSFINNYFN
jgi:hypothetical protein